MEYYGPRYKLEVLPNNTDDHNPTAYLDAIKCVPYVWSSAELISGGQSLKTYGIYRTRQVLRCGMSRPDH